MSISRTVIIPARGGSKRLPGKTLRRLGSQPMIYHTFDCVDGMFDRIIVTSDSDDILDAAQQYNWGSDDVDILKRPSSLASDTSKVIDTVSHYFDETVVTEQIWLCLPTCPLRGKEDVAAGISLLDVGLCHGVLSVTDYGFPPTLGMLMDADTGIISDWQDNKPWTSGNTRSQDHPDIFRPNGAFYGMWSSSFDMHRSFYKGVVRGVYMPRSRSVDIDTLFDFTVAEALVRHASH